MYKEDFKLEQEDKVKIQSEKKTLQERLLQCESHVRALSEEVGDDSVQVLVLFS